MYNVTKKIANSDAVVNKDRFILVWTTVMLNIFIQFLEEQHELGKRADTGFKSES